MAKKDEENVVTTGLLTSGLKQKLDERLAERKREDPHANQSVLIRGALEQFLSPSMQKPPSRSLIKQN